MSKKSVAVVGGAMLGAAVLGTTSQAFTAASSTISASSPAPEQQRFLRGSGGAAPAGGLTMGTGAAMAAAGLAVAASSRRARKSSGMSSSSTVVPVQQQYFRDSLMACQAQAQEAGALPLEEVDQHIAQIEAFAKQALAGAGAAMVFTSQMEAAVAYPIFAQQNYANPREDTGKIACANCHLAAKDIDVRLPQAVLPDTIFKTQIEIPAKYEKRRQPIADGSKGPMNVGAIAVMPEGWKLAPRDRLPKVLKKEMKGLAWSPYSKEMPNIVVAGPVPGSTYETMVLPILAPDPNKDEKVEFGKAEIFWGGNRGRGQVYPEGNQSNNNQFFASAAGKISAIDGLKITIDTKNGPVTQEVLPGANIVVEVGEVVKKDEPITTNPNVGGFGQAESEVILQDMNRVYAYCAIAFSIFVAQLTFVLKKKQFEKVQLAEGF